MKTFRHPRVRGAAFAIAATAALLAITPTVRAAAMVFNIDANGFNEVNASGVPGQGDLDGLALGTLSLDNGTGSGTTGSATFSLQLSNLDVATVNLTGHHIHQAPVTGNGQIVIDFGDPDTIRTGNALSGTVTNLPAATINAIFANPTAFYYNLHNAQFPGGAVRDQLVPEPSSAALLLIGSCAVLRPRRRAPALAA